MLQGKPHFGMAQYPAMGISLLLKMGKGKPGRFPGFPFYKNKLI
jgi:hypothetical protein